MTLPLPSTASLARGLVAGLALWAHGLGLAQAEAYPGRTFGFDEGLTNTSVMCLAQGADGLVYAGTEGGLFRFDGRRFERLALPADRQFITVLLAGRERPLWVGTRNGLGWLDNTWGFHAESGPLAQRVHGLGFDGHGRLWAHVGDQVFLKSGDTFSPLAPAPTDPKILRLLADPASAEVLLLGSQGLWSLPERAAAWSLERVPTNGRADSPLDVGRDGTGTLWLRTRLAAWRKAPGTRTWERLEGPLASGAIPDHFGITRDREGWLWINSASGLFRCRGGEIHPVVAGPKGYVPVTGMVDAEQSPWVASMGVTQVLGRALWTLYDADHGLPSNVVWTTTRDRLGRLWAATDGGLALLQPEGWKVVVRGQFSRVRVHPDGMILAVGSPGGVLYTVDPHSLALREHHVPCMAITAVSRGLGVEPDGTVWISDYANGLAHGRLRGGGWTWESGGLAAEPGNDLFEVVQDGLEHVFLPTKRTVYLREHGQWTSLGATLPFTPLGAHRLAGGDIWVAYLDRPVLTRHRLESGVWKQVEAWWPFQDKEDLLVFSLSATPAGELWVGTSQGLACLDPRAHRRISWWTPGDGLPGADATTQGLFLEPNGDLWFGCTAGLGRFRTQQAPALPSPPKPLLLSWEANGVPLALGSALPSLKPRSVLDVRFGVPTSLTPSQLRLEARIPGVDPGWVQVDNHHLRYSALASGSYTVEVRLQRPGSPPGAPLVLGFQVLPRWWETGWAILLYLVGASVGVYGLVVWRHRALQHQNLVLQETVAARTRDLQEANEDLTEANRFKGRFLATAAHDLKNPLTGILLQADLIAEEAGDRRQDLSDRAHRLHETASRMLQIINGLLETAAEEARAVTLHMDESNLPSLVHQVVAANQEYAASKDIRLTHLEMMAGECWGLVDEGQFRRAVDNLVNNAIKYSPPGGEVQVTTTPRLVDGRTWVEVLVSDQGPGLSLEDQARAFGVYQRLSAQPTGGESSTGLGLSIVKQTVELHGGRVWIESALGQGATFGLEIPLRASRHLPPGESAATPTTEGP